MKIKCVFKIITLDLKQYNKNRKPQAVKSIESIRPYPKTVRMCPSVLMVSNTSVQPKPLEEKPAPFSQKSVTANANGKDTRGRFLLLNGYHWRRGFTTLNKQLFRGNRSSFNESTAYLLIFNMFYTKQYFWIEIFLDFTMKKMPFYKRSH